MDFARLPIIAVVGMVLYDEALEIAVFVGAALILASNLMNIRAGRAISSQMSSFGDSEIAKTKE